LTRSDFRETEDAEKPPNTTASELQTTVFAPDGSTIILGGLLKLNQNKGGTKVPILGDIPVVGLLFRSINNRDLQSKLYIFVKTEIIRPTGILAQEMKQLETASESNRRAFEKHEQEFQSYQSWPGIKSRPVDPVKVLDAR
jgi:general secretion pathway protein D